MSLLRVDQIENTAGSKRFGPISRTEQTLSGLGVYSWTSIPDWVTKITVAFANLSLSGTDHMLVQLGVGGVAVTSGYNAGSASGAGADYLSTAGFIMGIGSATGELSGAIQIVKLSSSIWTYMGVSRYNVPSDDNITGAGDVEGIGVVDSLFLTRSGTNTFDSGIANIIYE